MDKPYSRHQPAQSALKSIQSRRSVQLSICLILVATSNADLMAQYNGSFGDVKQVAGLEQSGHWDVPTYISDDGLTIFLSTTRGGTPPLSANSMDLYSATRPSVSEPFSVPVRQDLSRNGIGEQAQTLSADGLTTYYTIDRNAGNTNFQTWSATRDTIDGEWNVPARLDIANGFSTRTARISQDELTLYFAASEGRMSQSNLPELYKVERASPEDPFEQAEPLGLRGGNPTVSSDELAIIYNRGSNPVTEKSLIATRESKDDPFGEPVELNDFGLGSQLRGAVGWQVISPDWPADGSKLYYSGTSTPFDPGSYEIYEATWSVGDPILGDVTGEGFLTVKDLDHLTSEIRAGSTDTDFDLDESGSVDLADRDFWVTDVMSTSIGDANLDGKVSATDLNALALNWRATDATSWSQGDFTGDGIVNATDLNALALNWQSGVAATAASPAAVPEPSSLAMLLFGLCALFRHSGRLPS